MKEKDKMIDFSKVEKEIADGYINAQKHPTADLRIFNYTARTQFEWRWNAETMACRGLIVDGSNRIVARPFEKFFSYDQLQGKVPNEPFEVYEKLDGSLGILYWIGDERFIATRGSFASEQAQRGTKILRKKYSDVQFYRSLTYLFEIIYAENQIVVDYGDMEDLILLAVIETATGKELPLPNIGIPVVKRYDGINEFDDILKIQDNKREGFVVRFQSGQRVKIKFEEYKRLHKLLTGINEKFIWESLRDGKDLTELVDRVPDEYYDWVKSVKAKLLEQYLEIETKAKKDFKVLGDRKETAMYFLACKNHNILFSMLDGKNYSDGIWKLIRPSNARAFRCDIDS